MPRAEEFGRAISRYLFRAEGKTWENLIETVSPEEWENIEQLALHAIKKDRVRTDGRTSDVTGMVRGKVGEVFLRQLIREVIRSTGVRASLVRLSLQEKRYFLGDHSSEKRYFLGGYSFEGAGSYNVNLLIEGRKKAEFDAMVLQSRKDKLFLFDSTMADFRRLMFGSKEHADLTFEKFRTRMIAVHRTSQKIGFVDVSKIHVEFGEAANQSKGSIEGVSYITVPCANRLFQISSQIKDRAKWIMEYQ